MKELVYQMMKISKLEKQRLLDDLVVHLEQNSDSKTKQWFDNYLKGAIAYRGLKTPQVTQIVKQWRIRNQLDRCSLSEQLTLCMDLIARDFAEDKFAGTIYLQKFLLSRLDYQILLRECSSMFERGYFYDWSTTDWFCTRILDPTIVKHGLDAANIIAKGRYSENLWQRRAAIVSFRHATKDSQYHQLIAEIIADLVRESERFIQTGIGWVLADMSKPYPSEAEALFRQHLNCLSKEVIDRHTKHLICHKELKQLKRMSLR